MNNFDKQLNQTGKQHNLVKNLITKYWYSFLVIKRATVWSIYVLKHCF